MKKTYIQPETTVSYIKIEKLMIKASPGAGGTYDPSLPIEAKPSGRCKEEEEEDYDEEEDNGSLPVYHSLWED